MTSHQPAPTADPYRIRPRVAWSALKVLLRDPEDTAQVFTIVRALSGRSVVRGHRRFARTATGSAILADKRDLVDTLRDQDALAAMPTGSLGRAYLDFMRERGITAGGLVDASAGHEVENDPSLRLYSRRLRDMHDLWHVTTGYGTDVMGEACLLAFTFAQTLNPGIAFIAIMGALRIARDEEPRILRALWAGFRLGRRARWLPAADWEALLGQPLEDVRALLNVGELAIYPELVPA